MRCLAKLLGAGSLLLMVSCTGTPVPGEAEARADVDATSRAYRPDDGLPPLPALISTSPPADFVRYACLRSPDVASRFYAWRAAVEEITVVRSLPDPAISFGADLGSMLSALTPALSATFPPSGRLRWAGEAQRQLALAERTSFEAALVGTAAETWSIYHEVLLVERTLGINREIDRLLADFEDIVGIQLQVARVTQQDLFRVQIERDEIKNDIRTLEDTRTVLAARLRRVLGIPAEEPDPPFPTQEPAIESTMPDKDLLAELLESNPDLRARKALVLEAQALVELARSTGGSEVMLKGSVNAISPVVFSPEISISLPIWEDKIAATIAGAAARRRAVESDLDAARLARILDLAQWLFLWRDAGRRLDLIRDRQLPKAVAALDVARTSYANGKTDITALLDAERSVRSFKLTEARAKSERESAWARVVYQLLGRPPVTFTSNTPTEGERK